MFKRISISSFILAFLASIVMINPASAVTTVNCGTSGTFTITSNVVTGNTSCSGTVTIPVGVTSVAIAAFINNPNITSVYISEGVTSLGTAAFATTASLTSVHLPSTLTVLGQTAFAQSSLTSIVLPQGLLSIGQEAFYNVPLTGTLAIPDSVVTISPYAFNFTRISYLRMGHGITSIGTNAFAGISSLLGVYYCGSPIPTSVNSHAYSNSLHPTCRAYVRYEANGGTGTMNPQLSVTDTALIDNSYTRDGYAFDGWSATNNGALLYADKASYQFVNGNDAILYARWLEVITPAQIAAAQEAVRLASLKRNEDLVLARIKKGENSTLFELNAAGISGASDKSLASINAELIAKARVEELNISEIKSIAHKYEIVENFSTPSKYKKVLTRDLVSIGLLSQDNPNKTNILLRLRKGDIQSFDSLSKLKAEIANIQAELNARAAHLSMVIAGN